MLPGSVDPRRPEKVQRYKPPAANANGQGEDLTPDYMNILGQRATTANAAAEPTTDKHVVDGVSAVNESASNVAESNLQPPPHTTEEVQADETAPSTNATNVIPTSPQYGVAIIPTNVSIVDLPTETVTISTDTVIDSTAKQDDSKDLHSTPSRNDRFKVVKIASLEPFKRGRWKCMDYVDEAPPPVVQPSKVSQSAGSISVPTGGVYLHSQSLPQQQIQQMLLQGGFTNGTQFFPSVQPQMIPQTQYFYQAGTNMQTQTLPQQLVNAAGVPSSMPTQFINASQPYIATGIVQNSGFAIPPNYANVQYVPANLIQNQNSAFVPTSQTVQLPANFQQSQTYAGQPNVTAPVVNGHAYPPPNEQVTSTSLPTQPAKSVILTTNTQQPVVTQSQISQPAIQPQIPLSAQSQSVPQQQYQQNPNFPQLPTQAPNSTAQVQQNVVHNQQAFEPNQGIQKVVPASAMYEQQSSQGVTVSSALDKSQTSNVYTNPQFDMNVNSLTILENAEATENTNDANAGTEATSDNPDDPSKTNPVVNAIDNKIEQAMDLVKSHLMYTVREEVEVLKEKIAELMERIQQLETENNFLRSQIPKSQAGSVSAPAPVLTTSATVVNPATATTSTAPSDINQQ